MHSEAKIVDALFGTRFHYKRLKMKKNKTKNLQSVQNFLNLWNGNAGGVAIEIRIVGKSM